MGEDYYKREVLKKLQKIELNILKEFDKICKDNNLNYFLGGGSAIGVVRHKGFIPWDDDIDVGMTREDYDKFLDIAKKKYSHKYTIMNNDENSKFPLMNTRWGLNGTEYKTEDLKDIPGEFGIFLDIFPLDNAPDDDKLLKKQANKAWFWSKILVLTGVKKPVLYYYGVVAKILKIVFYVAHYILKVLHINSRFCYKKAYKIATKYNDVKTKRISSMFTTKKYEGLMNKNDIFPTKKMKFEDFEVNVPRNIDKYLTTMYGDYMTLPPVEKRHTHPPYSLKFKK